jgi:GH24 family phage-related lysozyme (muramidase)
MTDEGRLESSVEVDEGFESIPYLDTEKRWTAGEGLCLETRPLSGAEWKYLLDNQLVTFTIKRAGADWLVRRDLAVIEQQLARDYADFWPTLNDARQNALAEWAFQLGVAKEEAFHVAIAAIREHRWSEARAAMLSSLWAHETSARAQKLAAEINSGIFA